MQTFRANVEIISTTWPHCATLVPCLGSERESFRRLSKNFLASLYNNYNSSKLRSLFKFILMKQQAE